MSRFSLRSLFRPGVLLIMLSTVGVAHAASLDASSDSLDAWVLEADIRDEDPPTITAAVAPLPNAAGWNSSTTVSFACSDGWSGIASCAPPFSPNTDGVGQIVTGTAVDNAGNEASASVTLDVDLTPPTVQLVGVADGSSVATVPTVTCTASDELSGLDAPCTVTVTEQSPGAYLASASATDIAGNVGTATAQFWTVVVCGSGSPRTPCVIPEGTVTKDRLIWNADVLVLGSVNERIEVTGGSVTIGSTGYVKKDITQSGVGDITVDVGAVVDGKIEESGDGSIFIDGAVRKHVVEQGPGNLTITTTGSVDLWAEEYDDGTFTLFGTVGKDVSELGPGDCTIDPGATVGGMYRGDCAP